MPKLERNAPSQSKERMAEYQRDYRVRNPERVAASAAAWRRSNKAAVKGGHLKNRYGITMADYDAMMANAGNACEICKAPVLHILTDGGRTDKACVDHDHATGEVRGILCGSCNKQLTFFERYAEQARHYLERAKMKSENEETQKPEQPALQGSHPSEVLSLAGLVGEDFPLGEAYCGTDGTCESCQ